MTPQQKLARLKRDTREARNRAFTAAGLSAKDPVVGKMRKLSPDDPRVLECLRNAGLRHEPYSLERR